MVALLRLLPVFLLVATVQATSLNVGTAFNGSDVVSGGVTQHWGDTQATQPCSQYWTFFYHNLVATSNTTFASVTPHNVADASVWTFKNDPSKLGVFLTCHESGEVTTNLTFANKSSGHVVSVFWKKDCVVYPVWYQLVDPGNLGMICIAVAMVVWGGLRTENAVAQQIQQEMGDDTEISIKKALTFVIGASVSLLLIFYFLKLMSVLLTISFCFVSTVAISMVLYSVLEPTSVGARLNRTQITIPWFGASSSLELGVFGVAVTAVLTWAVTRHWIANNILGMSICLYMMTVLRLPSIKVAAVLLTLLFFYDIFWVFYSEPIFGKNVMVTAAKGLDLPIKLLLPRGMTTPCYESSYTMLGLGDIALPGLLGVFTRRFDLANPGNKVGYFPVFVTGYTVGIVVTFVVLFVFKAAQPALLYLVPGTLGSVLITGIRRGQLKALWVGIKSGAGQEMDASEGSGAAVAHDHSSVEISEEVETAPMLNNVDDDRKTDFPPTDDSELELCEINEDHMPEHLLKGE